jgi:hypothetical protein
MTTESITEFFRNTEWGQVLRQVGHQEGHQEGQDQTRIEIFEALLHERFGDDPQVVVAAARLRGWPDVTSAVHAITTAASLDLLVNAEPPPA